MLGRLGTTELLIILGIILVIFGPSKLPEIGKSLGRGIREFKSATKEIKDSINVEVDEDDAAAAPEKPRPVKAKEESPPPESPKVEGPKVESQAAGPQGENS